MQLDLSGSHKTEQEHKDAADRAGEAAAAAPRSAEPLTHVDVVAAKMGLTVAQRAYLESLERKTVPGAFIRTPKERMFDTSDLQEQNPDKSYRWVNLQNREKVASRQAEGYTRVPAEEGGRALGDSYALFSISRQRVETRNSRQSAMTHQRLASFKEGMREAAESVAKQLQDNHGIRVNTNKLFVDER